jgi:hypothetical protein
MKKIMEDNNISRRGNQRWISKLGTVTYMMGETVIDNIARKVAEEPIEDWIVDDEN